MALVQQLIHLEPDQKAALLERKQAGHGSISEQLRRATERYLNDDAESEDELAIAMDLAKQAETSIEKMNDALDDCNAKLDWAFAEIAKLKGGQK